MKKKKNADSGTQTSAASTKAVPDAVPLFHESVPETHGAKNGSLKELELQTVESMEKALANVRELSRERLAAKQSVSRLTGVARELKELIKVMSVYGC